MLADVAEGMSDADLSSTNVIRSQIRPYESVRRYLASAVTGCAVCCFFFQSPIAARMASSARTEQWIFTGGSESSFTMSIFLIVRASSTVLPLTHSVASDEDAIAQPQPKDFNLASSMRF